ncbi:HTH_Tnp_Tc3_2 domain-containing protein [Trichonephila clavipes]|nr:HTH_Tnp_Tc3_2 domain-containing protein [Trichonephila clavipes]
MCAAKFQWLRDGTASKRPGWPRGSIKRKDSRIRRTAVVHRTASAAEIRAAVGTTVIRRTVRNRLLQGDLQAIAVCDASGVEPKLIDGRSGDLLCFLMKAGFALVPVVCWSE